MENKELFIYRSIVSGMTEGVLTVSLTGRITTLNKAAQEILSLDESVIGKTLATVFFHETENDAFNQAILEAIYQDSVSHNIVVDYVKNGVKRQLFVSTSYLKDGEEKVGVTVVFSDITELSELRDAVRAMEQIKALNIELEKRNEFIKKTFGRYLSDDIVKSILNTKEGLVIGGRKQNVTIMFTDLRGFTAISERMEPQHLITMLNYYLTRMIDIVQKHKGTILEFIGDAIVAVFGAPLESQTSDYDATACAIEMQCDMINVNLYNKEHGFPNIEMGIGIHSGDVVLGNIGSEKKTKYDIIGRNVNLASRVESYTVGGQVLISYVVKQRLKSRVVTGERIEIVPKGVSKPVDIFEVISLDEYKMPVVSNSFIKLDEPIAFRLSPLNGKDVLRESFDASILELSCNEAIIMTAAELDIRQNIFFNIFEKDIYAKVLEKDANIYKIHITTGSIKLPG